MSDLNLWIVKSTHKNPEDFYVKVDDSDCYTAYWVVRASDEVAVSRLVEEGSSELEFGAIEVNQIYQYPSDFSVNDASIKQSVDEGVNKLGDGEDAQLGAWISENGGLW